ncbi:MAG: GNAT family N-acetyltransferase [Planctomycetes bacterium]|nr:GNAT family N-acetyltransferase [Planctomycetota bacterium]
MTSSESKDIIAWVMNKTGESEPSDFAASGGTIRPINRCSDAEILLVAQKMRQTLIEVLGEKKGNDIYSLEWLIQRVEWHLDCQQTVAEIYLAEDNQGTIVGHTIVRKDFNSNKRVIGLFSTTFVAPSFRKTGVATELLEEGEKWILEQGLLSSETHTAEDNLKLINLFQQRGYTQFEGENKMVILKKNFGPSS